MHALNARVTLNHLSSLLPLDNEAKFLISYSLTSRASPGGPESTEFTCHAARLLEAPEDGA